MLHGGGVPVSIPRAERYAVHKLIVAVERQDQAKARKDIAQAEQLIEILQTRRPIELAEAWQAAWGMGGRWREKLQSGRERLSKPADDALSAVIARAETLQRARGSKTGSSARERR